MFCFLLRGKSKYREETKRATQEKQEELPVLDQSSLVDMAGSTGITMPSSPPPKKAVEAPIGLMTRAGAKAIQHEVTLCLEVSPLDMTMWYLMHGPFVYMWSKERPVKKRG